MIYNLSSSVAECYDCGETKPCTRMTAARPERETGYVDEIDFCADCLEVQRG